MYSPHWFLVCFPAKLEHPLVNKGSHLVETWGMVLVTSEYAKYATNMSRPDLQYTLQITCEMSAVPCAGWESLGLRNAAEMW